MPADTWKIAGVDFDSNSVDVAVIPWEGLRGARWFHVDLPRLQTFQRARVVRERLDATVEWDDVILCHLEEPVGRRNPDAYRSLCRVQGAILASIPPEIVVNEVEPSEWKQVLGLPPDAGKGDVGQCVDRLGHFPTWSEHALDALGIALAARQENREAIERAEVAAAS